MRTIRLKAGEMVHVETPLGIVNIRTGLSDYMGREVDSIETIASNYAGENRVIRRGEGNVRLIRLRTVKS